MTTFLVKLCTLHNLKLQWFYCEIPLRKHEFYTERLLRSMSYPLNHLRPYMIILINDSYHVHAHIFRSLPVQ